MVLNEIQNITKSKGFQKIYEKLPQSMQKRVDRTIYKLVKHPNLHGLHTEKIHKNKNAYSCRVTDTIRLAYEITDSGMIQLLNVGSHDFVYRHAHWYLMTARGLLEFPKECFEGFTIFKPSYITGKETVRIPRGFKGIVYEPDNEQETITLFLLLMDRIKPSWCIKQIRTSFPDGIFYDTNTQKDIRVEFEYLASHFIAQKHDEKGCDMIICWANDLSRSKANQMKIKILSLKDIMSGLPADDIYLGWKREGSLDKLLQRGVESGDRSYIAVDKLVNAEITKLEKKYSALFLDRKTTRHYVLRWEGKGIFGVHPDGRLVAEYADEYERKFGKGARGYGKKFRHTVKDVVKGLNVKPTVADKELNNRIGILKGAVEDFCKKLQKLS